LRGRRLLCLLVQAIAARTHVLLRCQERRLSQAPRIRTTYVDRFQCIGPACEDTCCQGWGIPIDRVAYEKYQNLPAGPLRTLIDESVVRTAEGADGAIGAELSNAGIVAQIRMNGANLCPLLSQDRLCRIHEELGEGLLPHTCATYPRIQHSTGGAAQQALALSCPEAARMVLLDPELLGPKLPRTAAVENFCAQAEEADAIQGATPLQHDFWPIRKTVLALVLNRTYPLWQRLFLLSVLCRRLDSIAKGELNRSVSAFLAGFEATVSTGALRPAMETLPVDRAAQLDVVLRLAGLLLHRSNIRPRFVECMQAFTAGIGNGPGATLDSLAANYALAHDRAYEPFFRSHPHIMENYLVNTIVRCQFPFGQAAMQTGTEPRMAHEFAVLTAQFALVRGLLIGVAGFHGKAFSTAHVVHTVQAAAKHFEHHPEFLHLAHHVLVESQMDGARGLAILLRNTTLAAPRPAPPTVQLPIPQASGPGA
jgi:lysine-N-methylase